METEVRDWLFILLPVLIPVLALLYFSFRAQKNATELVREITKNPQTEALADRLYNSIPGDVFKRIVDLFEDTAKRLAESLPPEQSDLRTIAEDLRDFLNRVDGVEPTYQPPIMAQSGDNPASSVTKYSKEIVWDEDDETPARG